MSYLVDEVKALVEKVKYLESSDISQDNTRLYKKCNELTSRIIVLEAELEKVKYELATKALAYGRRIKELENGSPLPGA